MKIILSIVLVTLLAGCSEKEQEVEGRWYSQAQVVNGAAIFKTNCTTCHGEKAQGIASDWRQTLADGSYPPPPLNGTAHAWHHPMRALRRTIRDGGIPLGGKMPAFKDKLSDEEIDSVIAHFQSMWNNKVYSAWIERGGLK